MTLAELWLLIKRYWKLVVILPVAAVLVCGVAMFAIKGSKSGDKEWTATSRIMVNSQVAAVSGIAASEARQAVLYDEDYTASAKGDGGLMTVTVTVTGPDFPTCANTANGIAERAVVSAEKFFAEQGDKENMIPFAAEMEPADPYPPEEFLGEMVAAGSSKSIIKYAAVALLGGLFVAICIVIIIDIRRRFVKTPQGVQEAVELPVLEILPAENGQRLLANIRFAAKKDNLSSIFVVPAGDAAAADEVRDCIVSALSAENGSAKTAVRSIRPLAKDMSGAYEARDADAIVVVASQWNDSLPQVESTVAELKLAEINIAGIAFKSTARKVK